MSIASSLTIAQPNPDGSLPVPAAPDAAANAAAEALQREAHWKRCKPRWRSCRKFWPKPLTEILAEHDKAKEAAAAWGFFRGRCGCCRSAPCAAWRWIWRPSRA